MAISLSRTKITKIELLNGNVIVVDLAQSGVIRYRLVFIKGEARRFVANSAHLPSCESSSNTLRHLV
jgi:hypothetical protein